METTKSASDGNSEIVQMLVWFRNDIYKGQTPLAFDDLQRFSQCSVDFFWIFDGADAQATHRVG